MGLQYATLSKKPMFILLSQSGETADSRQVLVKANQMGIPSLTVTNVPGSTLSREATYTMLYTLVLKLPLHQLKLTQHKLLL